MPCPGTVPAFVKGRLTEIVRSCCPPGGSAGVIAPAGVYASGRATARVRCGLQPPANRRGQSPRRPRGWVILIHPRRGSPPGQVVTLGESNRMLRQTAQPEMGQANPTFILLSFLMPSAHALTRPFPGHPHFIQDIYPHPLRSLLISSFSPQGRICKIVVVVGAGDMWITRRTPPAMGV